MRPEFRRQLDEREAKRRAVAKKRLVRLCSVGIVGLIVLTCVVVGIVRLVIYLNNRNSIQDQAETTEHFTYWNTIFDADPNMPKSTLNTDLFMEVNGTMEYGGHITTLNGIDVSTHNGERDWTAVAADGIDYVMLRLGNRGYTAGELYEDERFEEYYTGAKAAGLKVGAYFFSQAMTEAEAREEAKFAIKILDGRELDMPLAYDWETVDDSETRTESIDRELLTACTKEFCDRVQKAGYKSMIYTNAYQAYYLLNIGELADYDFWFAGYASAPVFYYKYCMWQYTNVGEIAGINGNVDRNIYFDFSA